jgi:hypothetical protein
MEDGDHTRELAGPSYTRGAITCSQRMSSRGGTRPRTRTSLQSCRMQTASSLHSRTHACLSEETCNAMSTIQMCPCSYRSNTLSYTSISAQSAAQFENFDGTSFLQHSQHARTHAHPTARARTHPVSDSNASRAPSVTRSLSARFSGMPSLRSIASRPARDGGGQIITRGSAEHARAPLSP